MWRGRRDGCLDGGGFGWDDVKVDDDVFLRFAARWWGKVLRMWRGVCWCEMTIGRGICKVSIREFQRFAAFAICECCAGIRKLT